MNAVISPQQDEQQRFRALRAARLLDSEADETM
jgi:hypothetical protein